jgi:hypothetical protein
LKLDNLQVTGSFKFRGALNGVITSGTAGRLGEQVVRRERGLASGVATRGAQPAAGAIGQPRSVKSKDIRPNGRAVSADLSRLLPCARKHG